ncbi:MAG: hypothetical protein U9N36_05725 [Euryarchaeota archaeon]|nr:hypothetical protein [Euryarchaeota archaeon]
MQHLHTHYNNQAEHFELIGDRTEGTPSCFPAVSKYSSYVYYGRNETDERYLMASWYFNDEKQFMQARIDLATYIKERGAAGPSGFHIPSRNLEFTVTKYESNTTSGYFITYIKPISVDQTDYFIVYYGLMDTPQISEQTRLTLRKLMAEGYYNESGMVEPLHNEEYFREPGWENRSTGPGLPPPAGMPMWYIPGYDTRIENETIIEDRSVAEHFELIGDRMEGCPSCFPAISQYCGYANYTRTGSDDRYLIAAWYFDDNTKFLHAEADLYLYLEEYGRVFTVELNISEEMDAEIKRRENRLVWGPTFGPKRFNVTEYESETTSGYFLIYKKPFLAGREDYFIVYYGLMNTPQISEQTRLALRELMAGGYYSESGMVGALLDGGYFREPGWELKQGTAGYPPPESMQVWYLPSPDYVSADFNVSAVEAILNDLAANGTCINETILAEHIPLEGVAVNETFAGHFSLIGERNTGVAPPFFPVLSQYCGYANYSRTGSDDRYLAGEWYFNDGEEFLRAEKELYQYLEEHGRVSTVELNISKGDATKYECETTSGYFLVYKNTFGREGDYFIVYYGAVGPVDLSNQAPFLKALIADRYPTGSRVVGGLKS